MQLGASKMLKEYVISNLALDSVLTDERKAASGRKRLKQERNAVLHGFNGLFSAIKKDS